MIDEKFIEKVMKAERILLESEGVITEELDNLLNEIKEEGDEYLNFLADKYRQAKARAEFLSEKIKKLKSSKASAEDSKEFFKEKIDNLMNRLNLTKATVGDFDISYRPSVRVEVTDEAIIPEKYIREKITKSVDKSLILKEYRTFGEDFFKIPNGVKIINNNNIQIN